MAGPIVRLSGGSVSLQRNSAVPRCLGHAAPKAVPLRRSPPQHQPTCADSVWQVVLAVLFSRQPDIPVYTAQPGVVTSRRRSWDSVLRSFIPVGKPSLFPVSVTHMSLMTWHPRFIFVEGPTAISFVRHSWVARRSITAKAHPASGSLLANSPHRSGILLNHHRPILPWT